MKILAIDLGDRRTGVAISDQTASITGEAFTIDEPDRNILAQKICDIISQNSVERIVLGNPKNMNFTEGDASLKSVAFAELLKSLCNTEIILWDERQTTITASHILSDAGKKRKKQRAKVDAVAASIILENYLDYLRLHR